MLHDDIHNHCLFRLLSVGGAKSHFKCSVHATDATV